MEDFTQPNDTYVPFSDGIILQSQGYINTTEYETIYPTTDLTFYEDLFNFNGDVNKIHKCQYCGKPDYHANCHAHKKWCPLYCDDVENQLSLGNDVLILSTILLIFTLIKKLKK